MLLETAVKSLFLSGIAIIALLALRRATPIVRHRVLLGSFVLLALTPFAALLPASLPPEPIPTPIPFPKALPASTPMVLAIPPPSPEPTPVVAARMPAAPTVHWDTVIPALWGITTFISLLTFVLGLYRLRSFRGPSSPLSERMTNLVTFAAGAAKIKPPRILLAEATTVPFAFGGPAPTLVLPLASEGWEDERLQAVLLHEMAHLRRNDFTSQSFARLVCAVYVWNPVVWRLYALLQAEAEAASDAFAVAAGVPANAYANHLYAIARDARGISPAAALPMARPNAIHPLEKRIMNLLKPTRSLTTRRILLTLSLPMVIGLAALCFRPVRAEGSSPHDAPPLNDARAFLKWSMDQYAAVPTFSAKWTWRNEFDGAPRKPDCDRTLTYAAPNRFRITSVMYKQLTHIYVCDGKQMVNTTKGYNQGAWHFPAPTSLAYADENNMSHPDFGGSLFYRFFEGAKGIAHLLDEDQLPLINDPKRRNAESKTIRDWTETMRRKLARPVSFGADVVINGEPCKTVVFNGGVFYDQRRAIISVRDGFVRRLEGYTAARRLTPDEIARRKIDNERTIAETLKIKDLSEKRKQEAIASLRKVETVDPALVTIEEFTEIKPNAEIPANAFDLSRTDTEP